MKTSIGHQASFRLELTIHELDLLMSLATDQLFRREFIDPKMPGHRRKPEELTLAKDILAKLGSIRPTRRMEGS